MHSYKQDSASSLLPEIGFTSPTDRLSVIILQAGDHYKTFQLPSLARGLTAAVNF